MAKEKTKAKSKAKVADKKKKNIKEVEIEEIEEIEEFDDEEFDFVEDDDFEEVEETPKKKVKASKVVDEEVEEIVELTMEERIIGIEKKQNVILIFVVITALLSLFTFIAGLGDSGKVEETKQPEEQQQSQSGSYDTSAFTKIKAQDIESLSKKETIVLWIGKQGCGFCGQYVPTITSVGQKFDETIYYVDLADIFDFSTNPVTVLDDEAYDLLYNMKTDKEYADLITSNFGSTPMTLIVKKNKVVGGFVGALDEATVSSALEDAGFKQK